MRTHDAKSIQGRDGQATGKKLTVLLRVKMWWSLLRGLWNFWRSLKFIHRKLH